ncbi:3-demethylubiquinone-9 3-methyltransferase [Aspergillus ellipticus CBS 707.79]|uniref:Ubiquinone biosynthesis O-methyltransferase, mitochondrial n=1 Tax=Aspergillus ellipticus CBS 707.79 TaxID=1448320 RepID=A0A319EX18_9EURO|nr:3-demethylubiquinone-9 3-methyltransferase [Aspergillus ellipticus CBS 707.79]
MPPRPTIHPLRTLRTLALPLQTRTHTTSTTPSTSVSASELSHFSALANSWWDPQGPSRALHLMNPLRHDFIAGCLAEFDPIRSVPSTPSPRSSPENNPLRYLDIGCGGGIFAESLARTIPSTRSAERTRTRAASITAIDPSKTLVKIARDHARLDPGVEAHLRSGRFEYRNCSLEELIAGQSATITTTEAGASSTKDGRYDMVTLFEVIEHIDNIPGGISPQTFLTNCLRMVKPGGWLIGSTIARTFPSWLVNQVIAEAPWPIGVVPKGTHEWSKFVNPGELEGWVQEGLMRGEDGVVSRGGTRAVEKASWRCEGVVYFPGVGWRLVKGSETWGNYFWAVKKGE